jgi:hypothetical protein
MSLMMKHGTIANLADAIHCIVIEHIVICYARLIRQVQLTLGECLKNPYLHYVCDVDDRIRQSKVQTFLGHEEQLLQFKIAIFQSYPPIGAKIHEKKGICCRILE